MKKLLWTIRWKMVTTYRAFRSACDAGSHRFVKKECLCGQRTTDDPRKCTVDWSRWTLTIGEHQSFATVVAKAERITKRKVFQGRYGSARIPNEVKDAIDEKLQPPRTDR